MFTIETTARQQSSCYEQHGHGVRTHKEGASFPARQQPRPTTMLLLLLHIHSYWAMKTPMIVTQTPRLSISFFPFGQDPDSTQSVYAFDTSDEESDTDESKYMSDQDKVLQSDIECL